MARKARFAVAAFAAFAACTDASVYEVSGTGQEGPDKALFQGTVCAPLATGASFPIKILFAVEGGDPPVLADDTDTIITALTGVTGSVPTGSEFALIGFHTVALAFTSGFVNGGQFTANALPLLQGATAQQTGPVSLQAPLDLANAMISDDMQTSCTATVQRTHYYVILLVASEDVTCTNPIFATALQSICQTSDQLENDSTSPYCTCIGESTGCESCLLGTAALDLKNLGNTYGGQVSIVPIYFRDVNGASDAGGAAADQVIVQQVQDIASAVGSEPIVTNTSSLVGSGAGGGGVLTSYDFDSLLSQPILTHLYAWNRNVLARGGQEYVDSDGDGLSDDEETNVYGTNPVMASTAQDGISDGLKVHLGLDPTQPVTLNSCPCAGQPPQSWAGGSDGCLDTDADGLDDCEETLAETNFCTLDTDGDGLSNLVELHSGTNPLVPEGTQDTDGDGVSNATEVLTHSDPNSVDLAFRAQRATWSSTSPATPTPDGRPCYDFTIGNVSLMATQGYTSGFLTVPAGANFIYLMAEWSYQGSAEISQTFIQQVLYQPPLQPSPASPILVGPDDFVAGT